MKNIKNQQGFVLVVSLVFLIALTGVASALMLNTTSDMKMSGASQEKVIAIQEAVSSVDEVILKQVGTGEDNVFVTTIIDVDGVPVVVTAENTTAVIVNQNAIPIEATCPASHNPSSDLVCSPLRVVVTKNYGNNETSSVVVNAGILQQVIKPGGS